MKILFLILLCALTVRSQENSNIDAYDFLPDRSDLTQALNAHGFQLQSGIAYSLSEFDSSSTKQFSIPSIIARYGITNNFCIQAKSEFDLNEYLINDDRVDKNSQVSYILIGLLYQINQAKRVLFFDQLSFLLDNSIPLNSSNNYYFELDMVFSTNLNNRFALEYGLGYGYQENTDGYSDFFFELEAYLISSIYCEVSYSGTIFLGNNPNITKNFLGLELDFLTVSDYQVNVNYSRGLNNDYSYIGGVFVYSFDVKN